MSRFRKPYKSLIILGAIAFCSTTFASGQNPRALFPSMNKPDSTIRISYLLPIAAKTAIALPIGNENKQNAAFLEFYEGSELALQYWRELGFSIEAHVLDTQDPDFNLSASSDLLEKSDLWIGPVYAEEFLPFSSLARVHQKTIVYPLSQLGEVWKNNPFVYQVASDNIELWKNMIQKEIFTSTSSDVLVFIQMSDWNEYSSYLPHILNQKDSLAYSPHTGLWTKFQGHKTLLKEQVHPKINARLIAYESGQNTIVSRNNLARILNSDHSHQIIVLSQDEAFLSDLLENLTLLATDGKYNIQLYGMPRWNKLESLNSNWFYQLNAHIPSAYYAHYDTPLAARFVQDFMQKHAMDPSPFAIQGFDITNYFIQKQLNFSLELFAPIQSRYQFEQINMGGFRNKSGFILEYTNAFEVIAH